MYEPACNLAIAFASVHIPCAIGRLYPSNQALHRYRWCGFQSPVSLAYWTPTFPGTSIVSVYGYLSAAISRKSMINVGKICNVGGRWRTVHAHTAGRKELSAMTVVFCAYHVANTRNQLKLVIQNWQFNLFSGVLIALEISVSDRYVS